MNFTRHTTEDGRTTYTVDSFDDETTASLEVLARADPAVLRVDWIGVRVTILGIHYTITAISDDHYTATLTKERP